MKRRIVFLLLCALLAFFIGGAAISGSLDYFAEGETCVLEKGSFVFLDRAVLEDFLTKSPTRPDAEWKHRLRQLMKDGEVGMTEKDIRVVVIQTVSWGFPIAEIRITGTKFKMWVSRGCLKKP